MELNVPTYQLKNKQESIRELKKLQDLVKTINDNLSPYSLNRYLWTPLKDVDFSKISARKWFKKENLVLAENNMYCGIEVYEQFIEFITEYALKSYQLELADYETALTDYQYIDFLVTIALNKEMENFEKAYCEYFQIKNMTLNYYAVVTFGMNFMDELPLDSFINMFIELMAKEYIQKNINLIEKGENELYNIDFFNR